MEKLLRKNASIIAQKNGKYLLVKKPRRHHAWQFPQGGVEENESFTEAAKREFAEELGCGKIEILGEAGVYEYEWPDNIEIDARLRKFRGQEVHLFLANFLGEDSEIKLQKEELEAWKWIDLEELKTLIESKEYLNKLLEILNAKN